MQLPETSYESHPVTSMTGLIPRLNSFIKQYVYVALPLFIFLALVIGGGLARVLFLGPVRTVTVIGTGTKRVKPEKAAVSFSMVYTGLTQQDAVTSGEQKFNAILGSVNSFNPQIDKTAYQVVNSSTTTTAGTRVGGGYQYVNAAKVTIGDPTAINTVVKALYDNGATVVGQIEYIPKDQATVDADVRAAALKDAHDRAAKMARASGLWLGKAVVIQEGITSGTTGTLSSTSSNQSSATTNLSSSGEVENQAALTVTYEMW